MPVDLDISTVGPGFSEPVHQSQATYRLILEAMAFPGRIGTGRFGLNRDQRMHAATAALCLTLLDGETPLWLQEGCAPSLAPWLSFHCGCPLVEEPAAAAFALILRPGAMPPIDRFSMGSATHPERSTTLILQLETLQEGEDMILSGPGIQATTGLVVQSLPASFWEQRRQIGDLYPQGVDILMTCGHRLAALPRTTQIDRNSPCMSL